MTIRVEQITTSSDALDFQAFAQIHEKEIQEGFLSTLGVRFLRQLYKALASCDSVFLLAARSDERIHGFICCSTNTRRAYRSVLTNHGLRLLPIALPQLITPKRAWHVLETLVYPFQKEGNRGQKDVHSSHFELSAEILNFCVSADSQRLGIGRKLFAEAMDEYRRRNVSQIQFVTGQNQLNAQRFYDSLGAERLSTVQVHSGTCSVAYRYTIPVASEPRNTAA